MLLRTAFDAAIQSSAHEAASSSSDFITTSPQTATSRVIVSDIMTGKPAACASTTETGKPSLIDGKRKTSAA